ncbi:MAG: energy transducer TonB [Deltaproteobacteria bacterium]|nr:energy transducer TonB [Deltaproteobacteria bacterium]
MSCDHHRKRDVPLALVGAFLINLLIMALIPWLFRGGGGSRELPHLVKDPIFLEPVELDQEQSQAVRELEPRLELELPEPAPEILRPRLPIPEINPEIEFSKVMLDARIDTDFELQPLAAAPVTPVPTLSRPDFYRIGEVDREPLSTTRMEPVYPFLARRRGIEGSVKLRFFVTRQGRVEGVDIIKAEPPGYFEKTVRETVSNWRFQAGMVDGTKVKTLVETTIVFKLAR